MKKYIGFVSLVLSVAFSNVAIAGQAETVSWLA
jgi:hypothetical protein